MASETDDLDIEMFSASNEHSRKTKKREARPIFDLILGILDTFQTAASMDAKRAKEKEIIRRSLF